MITKYFHELTETELNILRKRKVTWKMIKEKFNKPEWCTNSKAFNVEDGCFALQDDAERKKLSTEYCKICTYYKYRHNERKESIIK